MQQVLKPHLGLCLYGKGGEKRKDPEAKIAVVTNGLKMP